MLDKTVLDILNFPSQLIINKKLLRTFKDHINLDSLVQIWKMHLKITKRIYIL